MVDLSDVRESHAGWPSCPTSQVELLVGACGSCATPGHLIVRQAGRKTGAILVLIKQVIGTIAFKPVAAPVLVRYHEPMTDTAKTMTGAEFSQALADLGWRQTEFAARTGTSPDTINRWCNGRQPIPTWAQRHVELLLAAAEFHRQHVEPWPRTRRKAGADDQPDGESA